MIPDPDSPQLEFGYTRIANKLLQGLLAYPFSGSPRTESFTNAPSAGFGW